MPEGALGARAPTRALRRSGAADRGVDDDMMMKKNEVLLGKMVLQGSV